MSNVEGMNSVYLKRLSEAKPSFEILRFDIRHSVVRCSGHLKSHISYQGVEVLNTDPPTVEHLKPITCSIAVGCCYGQGLLFLSAVLEDA